MSEQSEVVDNFIRVAWNEGNRDAARAMLATDFVDHDPAQFPGRQPGGEGLLQVVAMIRGALPDLQREVLLQLSEGDTVVTSFVDHGTHTGELFGVAATGRTVHVRGINIERVVNGHIAEMWHVEDLFGLMAQIGPRD